MVPHFYTRLITGTELTSSPLQEIDGLASDDQNQCCLHETEMVSQCIAYAIHTIDILCIFLCVQRNGAMIRFSSCYNWIAKNSSKAHRDPKTRTTFGRDATLMGLRGILLPILFGCAAS